MFGNTWSPGGMRRGPIWISGNQSYKDERWVVFSPASFSSIFGKTANGIVNAMPSGGLMNPDMGSTYHGYQEIFLDRFDTVQHTTEFDCPLYPYETQQSQDSDGDYFTSTFADEKSLVMEIDMLIDPYFGSKCDQSGNILYPTKDETVDPIQMSNTLQFTNSLGQDNKIYSMRDHGQGEHSLTNNTDKLLNYGRIITPPCPMRIRGFVVCSDYCFAMSSAIANKSEAIAAIAGFPVDSLTQYFEDRLMTEMPEYDHSPFYGANYTSPPSGNYYQDWTLGNFLDHAAAPRIDRTDNRNGNLTEQRYFYTKGCLFGNNTEGNSDITFYFSPCLYPYYFSGGGSDLYNGDIMFRLKTRKRDETTAWSAAKALYGKHADPGFLSPVLYVPALGRSNAGTSDGGWYRPYVRRTAPGTNYVVNNNWPPTGGGSIHLQAFGSGMPNNNRHTFNICAAHGVYQDAYSPGYGSVPFYFRFNNQSDKNYVVNEGVIQPKVERGEKYLQDVTSVCANYQAGIYGNNGGFSGRYKFIGFRGTISFFETNNNPKPEPEPDTPPWDSGETGGDGWLDNNCNS